MKTQDDIEIELWLEEEWDGSVEWDDANRRKLTHDVLLEEVDVVFANRFVVLGRILPPEGAHWPPEKRFVAVGKNECGPFYYRDLDYAKRFNSSHFYEEFDKWRKTICQK